MPFYPKNWDKKLRFHLLSVYVKQGIRWKSNGITDNRKKFLKEYKQLT